MISESQNISPPQPLVILGMGGNLGDRLAHLRAALEALEPAYQIERLSSVYETAPQLVTDQPAFYNLVCIGYTSLTPQGLLRLLKELEARLGRQSRYRYGPREIDLDILLYGDLVMETDDLTIPHPRLAERAFVLVPLAEIAPNLPHPVLKRTIHALAEQVSGQPVKRLPLVVSEQFSGL